MNFPVFDATSNRGASCSRADQCQSILTAESLHLILPQVLRQGHRHKDDPPQDKEESAEQREKEIPGRSRKKVRALKCP